MLVPPPLSSRPMMSQKRPLDWQYLFVGLKLSASKYYLFWLSFYIVLACRVMDLSKWSLPGLLTSLLEVIAEGHLPERVSCLLVPTAGNLLMSTGVLLCTESPEIGPTVEYG